MVFFLIGALLALIPCLIVGLTKKKSCPDPQPQPAEWNASDYQSNYDYYRQFEQTHDLTPTDNILMDRLSWPRFCPGDSSKIVYLRRQFHMPDFNGSSTTLHWVDMSDPVKPKTVQLTRPKWGTHDQQVKYEELVEDMM